MCAAVLSSAVGALVASCEREVLTKGREFGMESRLQTSTSDEKASEIRMVPKVRETSRPSQQFHRNNSVPTRVERLEEKKVTKNRIGGIQGQLLADPLCLTTDLSQNH